MGRNFVRTTTLRFITAGLALPRYGSTSYLLRIILIANGFSDPALGLVEGPLAESYSARNLSPRPNGWRNVWR